MVVEAVVAERLTTTFRTALGTDRGTAIRALSNRWSSAANRLCSRNISKFDLTGWMHFDSLAKGKEKMGRRRLGLIMQDIAQKTHPILSCFNWSQNGAKLYRFERAEICLESTQPPVAAAEPICQAT